MIRRPPRSTLSSSSAASDVYKRQSLNQPFLIIQNFFDRNDPYIILNRNFKIVVLRAGCAQLFFSEFFAENASQYVKSDFNGGL